MTKQVRFDSLKPGDVFEFESGSLDMKLDLESNSDDNAVVLSGKDAFSRWPCARRAMVTPRPDITAAIKKIVGGVE